MQPLHGPLPTQSDVMRPHPLYIDHLFLACSLTINHSWEDLEEKPVDGQWEYFERKSM